ncbi:Ribosomal RNA small subunit methyltransferase F [termite gut metagenome]|uniref:Ribosomal RNA small subunit methyltransferase F n=1 Tax=termite gut metagenome TaxID=433724 RepID=A0A5J4QZ47_9ZZZZ
MRLPGDFIKQMRALLGDEDCDTFITALQQAPAPASVRLNTWKTGSLPLSALHFQLDREIRWCTTGYYLTQRPAFTFDPLFHAGCYYVQEASSMFLEQVMKQYVRKPVVMLDLCAAPGGKSTHIQSLLPKGSLLVANEIIRNRSRVLAENLTKWGYPDLIVTNNDPADFAPLTGFFDVILADVPCSGEGMFRKDAGAINEWSPENVELCRRRQRRILSDSWTCLKPEGILIYSTCTYNTKENEENVQWMQEELGAEPLSVDIPEHWNVTGCLTNHAFPVYRFLPYKTEGEGFFMAILRKPFEADHTSNRLSATTKRKRKTAIPLSTGEEWVMMPSGDYQISVKGAFVTAFPKSYESEREILEQTLRMIQSGTAIGEIKGKDLIPQQALAMNRLFRQDAFPAEDVSYKQALAYLRKGSVSLSKETPFGYVLIRYKGVPLGFVKNIGSRLNNLYPSEWRIRSSYLPEESSADD